MEKEKIINLFLERGMFIDREGLDHFQENPEQVDTFIERVKQLEERPKTVSIVLIKKLLEAPPVGIEEIKKVVPPKKNISVDDVSKILVGRYERIQKYFSNRIDLVNPISINKIREKAMRFSLIVMVKEKNEGNKTLEVEDLTGEAIVHVDNEAFDFVLPDEVLGIVCEKTNEMIEAVNILWPDIPLKREIPKLEEDVYCMFLSDLHLEQDFESKTKKILKEIQSLKYKQLYIFLFGKNSTDREQLEKFVRLLPVNVKVIIIHDSEKFEVENTLCFLSPVFLSIGRKINLLLCDGGQLSPYKEILNGKKPEEIMLNLLKVRHLDPVFRTERVLDEDRLLIDTIPDIFVSGNFGPAGMMNYKGTTIVSCGNFLSEPVYWIVGLRTRESIKINFT